MTAAPGKSSSIRLDSEGHPGLRRMVLKLFWELNWYDRSKMLERLGLTQDQFCSQDEMERYFGRAFPNRQKVEAILQSFMSKLPKNDQAQTPHAHLSTSDEQHSELNHTEAEKSGRQGSGGVDPAQGTKKRKIILGSCLGGRFMEVCEDEMADNELLLVPGERADSSLEKMRKQLALEQEELAKQKKELAGEKKQIARQIEKLGGEKKEFARQMEEFVAEKEAFAEEKKKFAKKKKKFSGRKEEFAREKEAHEKSLECPVCMDNRVSHVFMPCGHVVCKACANNHVANHWTSIHQQRDFLSDRKAKCPVCKGDLLMIPMKIYLS